MMNRPLLILASTLFAVSTAFAQGAAGGTGGAAGAGGTGYRQSAGAPGANVSSVPGWSTMTAQERGEMQQRMQSFRTYDECRSYMSQQSERMRSRQSVPAAAPSSGVAAGDPCAHLPRG